MELKNQFKYTSPSYSISVHFLFAQLKFARSATCHYKRNCLTELLKGITNYLQHLKHNLQNVAFHFLAPLYISHVGFSDRQKLIH